MEVYLDLTTSTLTFSHLSHRHFPSTLDSFRCLQPLYHHRKFSRVHRTNLLLCFFFHPSSHPIALVAATASFAPHLPRSAPSFHLVLQIHLISLTSLLQFLFMFGVCNFHLCLQFLAFFLQHCCVIGLLLLPWLFLAPSLSNIVIYFLQVPICVISHLCL
jgi:hypothetical protein